MTEFILDKKEKKKISYLATSRNETTVLITNLSSQPVTVSAANRTVPRIAPRDTGKKLDQSLKKTPQTISKNSLPEL